MPTLISNTLIPDCEKSSRIVADEHVAIRRKELRILHELEDPHLASWYRDGLGDDLADVILLMLQQGAGRGATLLINDLEEVTDKPLSLAIDLLFKAAAYKFARQLDIDLQEVVGGWLNTSGPTRSTRRSP